MPQIVRHQLWIAAAAGLVLFCNLGGARLFDQDEADNATCAREMLGRDDWVVPTFNQKLSAHKPILVYWLMMSSYEVLGDNEFAARFPAALLALGTTLLTYHIGRRLFRAEVGLWAAIILCTAIIFDVSGRAATADSLLVFCITLSVFAFVQGAPPARPLPAGNPFAHSELNSLVPRRWLSFACMYGAMGLAVLTKGPLGVLLPVAMIGLYLLAMTGHTHRDAPIKNSPSGRLGKYGRWLKNLGLNFCRATWSLRPLTLFAVVTLVALPWYVAVHLRTDGEWTREFFLVYNMRHFRNGMHGHQGPIYFHPLTILLGFMPWSILLPAGITFSLSRIRHRSVEYSSDVFLICWLVVVVGAFSCAATKLPSYVLPAYPALALMTGAFVDRWIAKPARTKIWLRVGLPVLGVFGIAVIVALPIAAQRLVPGEGWLGGLGIVPLVGAGVAFWFNERQQAHRAMVTLCATAVALGYGIWGIGAARVGEHQNSVPLIAAVRELRPDHWQLASYRYSASSLVYYTQKHVNFFSEPRDVANFLASGDDRFVVVPADYLEEVQSSLPSDVQILVRQRRFAREGKEILLLGRTPSIALQTGRRHND